MAPADKYHDVGKTIGEYKGPTLVKSVTQQDMTIAVDNVGRGDRSLAKEMPKEWSPSPSTFVVENCNSMLPSS